MKIILCNPNMTRSVTDLMLASGQVVAASGTELVPATAARGFPYISSRAEAQVGGVIALEMLAGAPADTEAAIIAAFGDPGLFAARELFDFPVIGVSEAAMLTAAMLGQRFGILTFSGNLLGWYRDCVDLYGMTKRCAAIQALDLAFADVTNDQEAMSGALIELADQVVRQSGAEVLILGGAPLAGLARQVADRIPVPIIDPVAAAVKQAEALVALRARKAIAGSFRRPASKATVGLDDKLAARIEHRQR